jgi:hypothetical protein
MIESQVVQGFSESLKEHDLAKLQDKTSSEFEKKAIQGDETFEALKLLNLPEGKHKVVKVTDKKDDDKKVIGKRVKVEVGDGQSEKTTVYYHLKLDKETGKWAVDDLFLSRTDEKKNKSVAARVAVLLSLRESLDAWRSADRERMLATATPEFSKDLSQLSPEHLKRFARQITSDMAEQPSVMSNARIGDEISEMRVARGSHSELALKFRRIEGRWKLDDLEVESRRGGEGIASARQTMSAMAAAIAFQNSYRSGDKRRLKEVTTEKLFQGSLAAADLSQVRLPGSSDGQEDFDVRLEGSNSTFVVKSGPEVLKISLVRQATEQIHETPVYLVEDVTIYELNGNDDKRLSALFTGQAAMTAFSAALSVRDLAGLRAHATHDFKARAWTPMKSEFFARLPLSELQPVAPRIVQTDFKGSLLEILVEQGDTPLTYVLRDEGGRMLVDDVLVPATSRPESLKTNVELMLPYMEFIAALERGTALQERLAGATPPAGDSPSLAEVELIRGKSTSEFSRLIWNQYEKIPEFDRDPLPHLQATLSGINVGGDRAVLVLGNKRFGAEIRLQKERGEYKVDDVRLIFGPAKGEEISMKRALRRKLIDSRPPFEPTAVATTPENSFRDALE